MRHRPLGRTGLSVSEIGFGCGPTAGLMVDGSPEDQLAVVARALELGIDYFDTAPTYGDGASERNLGRCLRELGAAPMVATKVALTAADLSGVPPQRTSVAEERTSGGSNDGLAGKVERSVEASLDRLGLEAVPIVQLHNRVGPERAPRAAVGTGVLLAVDDLLRPGGVVEGFRRLRERGLARWFGCSAFGGDMDAMARLVDSGLFDVLTVHYSRLNPTAWTPLRELAFHSRDRAEKERQLPEAGDGRGGLESAGPELPDHESAFVLRDMAEKERRLPELDYQGVGGRAAAAGMGVIGLRVLEGGRLAGDVEDALRFALGNPGLASVIVGFSDLGQVEQAAAVSYSL